MAVEESCSRLHIQECISEKFAYPDWALGPSSFDEQSTPILMLRAYLDRALSVGAKRRLGTLK